MNPRRLKNKLLASFLLIILVLGLFIFLLGVYVIHTDVFARTQNQVTNYLIGARKAYRAEIDRIGEAFHLVSFEVDDLDALKVKLRLDYLAVMPAEQALQSGNPLVRTAAEKASGVGGTRIVPREQIDRMGPRVQQRCSIEVLPTPHARPTERGVLQTGMAKEYAMPLFNEQGAVRAVVYGGRIVNQDYALVDRIREMVFGSEVFDGKPVGTVTIFQDDIRISTNVLNENRERAIGTRVSEEVYHHVVERGRIWRDRAFVVTDWYRTAYEPIRNVDGEVIGILYVGILERPFSILATRIFVAFIVIIVIAAALGTVLAVLLAGSISRPLTSVVEATQHISGGSLGHEAATNASIAELNLLAESFNEMSARLREREANLTISNEKLAVSNQNYLDMIGFVTHELKGLLASAIMNAYALRDGYLGMINFKQKKAIDSICRNLDYLTATVKKFLNLSRIEKGDLEINRMPCKIRPEVFDAALDTFSKLISDKHMTVENEIDPDLVVNVDADLMTIAANNLVNNAAKYGVENGRIALRSEVLDGRVRLEVYNDGRPIDEASRAKLFKKFSRLDTPEKKRVKGTGLGLYITRQIIEAHAGRIDVRPEENGNTFVVELERGL